MLLMRLVVVVVVASALLVDIFLRYRIVRSTQPVTSIKDWKRAIPCPVVALLAAVAYSFIGWPAILLLLAAVFGSVDMFQASLSPLGGASGDQQTFDKAQAVFSGLVAAFLFGCELVVAALSLRSVFESAAQYVLQ